MTLLLYMITLAIILAKFGLPALMLTILAIYLNSSVKEDME